MCKHILKFALHTDKVRKTTIRSDYTVKMLTRCRFDGFFKVYSHLGFVCEILVQHSILVKDSRNEYVATNYIETIHYTYQSGVPKLFFVNE